MCDIIHTVLIFFVNGKKIEERNADPEWNLLYYLRNKLRLCGTKLGCGEGGCGACTVMVSKYNHTSKKVVHLSVNACLIPVCSLHGMAITTIEGIGSVKSKLHPIQKRLAQSHGSQCGFCTPGIVMSMYTLLRNMQVPSTKEIELSLQGNLCRCTGYRPIIEALNTFSEEWEIKQRTNGSCKMGDKCCKFTNKKNGTNSSNEDVTINNQEQEVIFPPELKLSNNLNEQILCFKSDQVTWHRPISLQQLLKLKQRHPEAKLVVGNTEIGVETKFKQQVYPILICPSGIKEMTGFKIDDNGITVGASMSLHNLNAILQNQVDSQPEYKTYILKAIIEMLQWFAGKQIRNVASIGGNIVTGSPISDLNPIFMAASVELELASLDGSRRIKLDNNFYTGYRKNILHKNEILKSILIPYTKKNQYFFAHKQSRRRDDDITIVNAAINVNLREGVIDCIRMAFGGLGPTTKMAPKTSQELIGKAWNKGILDIAYEALLKDLPLTGDAPGGMVDYRKTLPMCFFFRTYLMVCRELNKSNSQIVIDSKDLSAIHKFNHKVPSSSQFYNINTNEGGIGSVGKPIVHTSAYKQSSGEAIYLDDIPHVDNEMYLAFVYSKKAHANIKSIDYSSALKESGVIGFISADDTAGFNSIGAIHKDEELFITKTVTSEYQYLGAILAESQATARKAANKVEVAYEEKQPIIVTIEDAIKHNSFFDEKRKLEIGNVDDVFNNAKHIVEGQCRTGYQEHFYFEPHGCLVIPKEEDDLEIFSSTQNPAEITDYISMGLNIKRHKIVTRVKRIGGGFGGKQSRGAPIALAAAMAARKFKRPVRVILDRDEDIASTGGRHPYLAKYKAAFDKDGKILAYEAQLYANCGFSYDLSIEVLERAVFHIENCYKIPNLRVIGHLCKTNIPTNTAFRGFGAPQAMFAAENMIRDIAEYLKLDEVEIMLRNLYKEGDLTHYNQNVINCNLKQCIDECLTISDYHQRKKEIASYNSCNRWKKRGISFICTKYGVGFGVPFLEQAGALVMIYVDGSVLLTHSGIEMGQGLNSKMIQIASNVFQIPIDNIYISECATDKVPNGSPTAASVSSDLNGMAVLRACNVIMERLKPVMEQNPKGTWEDWVKSAYFERISLSATGFYCTPDILYNWETNTGKPYNYYTFGAACTEVEIDCLTGDHQILRTDIVMDLGCSLNPAIDIGQIEGAFMQGYGLFVLEELVVSPKGTVYSKGPGAYKIPSFADIPKEFNVALLKGVSNPRAIFSSKAVGEPPLFLASSTLFAIREAIKSARKDANVQENFRLNAPATADKIRMACSDKFTFKVEKTSDGLSPWNVVL